MKKNSRMSFRGLLLAVMGLHKGRVQELIRELEGGARIGRWTQQMSNEFGAGVAAMRILVQEHNEKHPQRSVALPKRYQLPAKAARS